MIAIIDYGLGNVRAFAHVFSKLRVPAVVTNKQIDLEAAKKIILPGVGAFDYAMKQLDKSGLRPALDEIVNIRKVPILGVCVGMQMFACSSEEGRLPGLGWIDGTVKKFEASRLTGSMKIPHMGWNEVSPKGENMLFQDLERGARFYFLHSYYISCKKAEDVIAVADYGGEFASAVNSANIFGVQFHPEKSHLWGIRLLKNFADL